MISKFIIASFNFNLCQSLVNMYFARECASLHRMHNDSVDVINGISTSSQCYVNEYIVCSLLILA